MASGSAAADTVVVVSVQRCSSPPHALIKVTELGKGIRSAHLDVYHEIEHGERPAWAGLSDKHGVATLPELEPGDYRVVADYGKLNATMFLTVSGDGGGAARCEIKLTPPDAPRTPDSLPEQTASIRVRQFRGVIEDTAGGVIRRATIRVLRKSSDKQDLAKIQSDEKGRFSLHLKPGPYLAAFEVPGFTMQVVSFMVSKDGWDAVKLIMEFRPAAYVPPEKWDWSN